MSLRQCWDSKQQDNASQSVATVQYEWMCFIIYNQDYNGDKQVEKTICHSNDLLGHKM